MANGGPNKRVTYLFDYFDYNLFGIKLVNALRGTSIGPSLMVFINFVFRLSIVLIPVTIT
jgi:hypothetical protein